MEAKTLNEIRIQGFDVLVKNLGPADAIRLSKVIPTGAGIIQKSAKTRSKRILIRLLTGLWNTGKRDPGRNFFRPCSITPMQRLFFPGLFF